MPLVFVPGKTSSSKVVHEEDATQEQHSQLCSTHSVSPAFSLPCLILVAAYAFLWAGGPSFFVSLTNLCYTAVAYQRVLVLYLKKETIVDVLGVTATSSFIYTFLGAASLSFHLNHTLSSPAHYFDILAGTMLMTHVLYVLLSINLYWLVLAYGPRYKKGFVLLSSASYIAAVTTMISLFEDVHESQPEIYLAATVSVGVLYLSLHRKFTASPTRALSETLVVLTCIVAASFSQSEYLGREYHSGSDEYGFYHGNWHFLMAVGTSIVYSRCTDAILNIEDGRKLTLCCSTPYLDRVGLLLLFLYSVLLLVLKESGADLSVTIGTLSVVAIALALHGGATVHQTWLVTRTASHEGCVPRLLGRLSP